MGRHELSDNQALAERLQAEAAALQQQHADYLAHLAQRHQQRLSEAEEQSQHELRDQTQQHEAAVQSLKVRTHDQDCKQSWQRWACLYTTFSTLGGKAVMLSTGLPAVLRTYDAAVS